MTQENQRIRLSKKLLHESLITLLGEKSIHKISVREICQQAEINRTTFYKYYGSQFDLLQDIENELLDNIERYIPKDPTQENDQLALMLTFMEQNRDLCRILLNNNIDPQFPQRLMNLPSIRAYVTSATEAHYTAAELDYLYSFIATGGQTIITDWLNKDRRESPQQLAAFIRRMIQRLI